MAVTRVWKVYGEEGHRQKVSFCESSKWDFSKYGNVRIIEVDCADKTGTNEYVIVKITRNTAEDCERELWGQITDGLFENARTGMVIEVE